MKYFIFSLLMSIFIHIVLFLPLGELKLKEVDFKQRRGSISIRVIRNKIKSKKEGDIKKSQQTTIKSEFLNGIKSKPSVRFKISPEYPYRSRLLKEEGLVKVKVSINGEGIVSEVSIVSSSGHKRLDEAVAFSLRQTIFVPARDYNNSTIADSLELEFNFVIDGENKK